MFRIGDLRRLAGTYLDPAEVDAIHRAFVFGANAHGGQRRASGEPYIHHPIQVAQILAEMRLDHETIVAAILHDVIEDTPTAKTQIATSFGDTVADLVDGVSKLTHLPFESRAEAQAENFRKMLMAMARDLRVILIKLADRLHNMRTLDPLPLEKQRRISRETLEIYAPIANRLGLRAMLTELEDLGFRALHPRRHRVLETHVRKARGHRKQVVRKIETATKRRLRQEGVKARVEGRRKHLYSLYRKMRTRRLSFKEVFDVYGFRVIVERPDDCYRVLGIVHSLYKPVAERFKDYVAIPKANGYQSLHTTLMGPFGSPIEVQIRTEEMDQVAESGVAAHWMYKIGQPGANTAQLRVREWVRDLLEMQTQAGDSVEFLESVKVDLFPKETYVFTPAGEIRTLPRGATPVDFALRGAHRHRQPVRGGQGGRPLRTAARGAHERPDGRDRHHALGAAERGVARLRRLRQGPLRHPQPPQAVAHGGGGGAGGDAARPGPRGRVHRTRRRAGRGGGRAAEGAEAQVDRGAARGDRIRPAARAADREAASRGAARSLRPTTIRRRTPARRSTSGARKGWSSTSASAAIPFPGIR